VKGGEGNTTKTMDSRENVKAITMNLLPLLLLIDIKARYRAK
jgi:hypothetical protein